MAVAFWAYTASGCLALYGMVLARRHVRAPGSRWLFWLTMSSAAWMFANAMTHAPIATDARIVWAYLSSVGMFVGPLWLLFALEYTARDFRAPASFSVALISLSFGFMVAALTNPLHHWFWQTIMLDPATGILIFDHGWLYTVSTLLGLMAVMPCILLFMIAAYRTRGLYRAQAVALTGGLLVQVITYIVFLSLAEWPLGIYPAMSTGFMMGIVVFAIERLQFLGTVPVGRAEMVDNMPDGFLVFDLAGRTADSNRAARELLGVHSHAQLQGRHRDDLFTAWRKLGPTPSAHVDVASDSVRQYARPGGVIIETHTWPLRDAHGELIGAATVLRDVTTSERVKTRIEEATSSVATWVREMNAVEAFVGRSRRKP
jgi:PAS domain S-box-containing protein